MPEAGDSRTFTATQALPFSLTALRARLIALWRRVARISRRPEKRLQLCESLPLGERRFVAVVEFERARFLVGGTATSLVLLSRLGRKNPGEENLREKNSRENNLPEKDPAEKNPRKNRGGGEC